MRTYRNLYKGIPIGSPLSQLLANSYLNKLDYFVKHSLKEPYYLRFSDDFTVLSREGLKKTENEIRSYVRKNLTLELHPRKTLHATPRKGVDLLGYEIFHHHKRIRDKNIQ